MSALVLDRRLAEILVSGENDRIYNAINPNDPAFIGLVESIRTHGVMKPLGITEDDYLVDGHRRLAACKALDLKRVPCMVHKGLFLDSPEFLTVLRQCNNQRAKGLDEILRENMVDAATSDIEAADAILEDRLKRSTISLEPMELRELKTRSGISPAKEPMVGAILQVLEDQADFLPITDRQIHYRLLNDPPLIHASKAVIYGNNAKSYRALCELLTRGRLACRIPWDAIEDPTRPVTTWNVFGNPEPYIAKETENLFTKYWRDLLQSQPHHIEIIGEKNTIAGIIRPIAAEFTIPFTIGRGYASIQPRYELAKRFRASQKEMLILLFLTDFDPDGEEIAHSFARSMRDDFGINELHPIKVGLNSDQVKALNLVPVMKAKAGSSGFDRFTEENGQDVFELESIPPRELQRILREAILSVIDVDAFNAEAEQERADQVGLVGLKAKMLGAA